MMTRIADVIELVGSSDKSWQDAAQVALEEARKTIHEITGLEVVDMSSCRCSLTHFIYTHKLSFFLLMT